MDPVVHMNDLQLDNITFPEQTDMGTTPASLDPDCIHKHLDGKSIVLFFSFIATLFYLND